MFFFKKYKNSKRSLASGEFSVFILVNNPKNMCLGSMLLVGYEPLVSFISLRESHLYNT